MLFEGPRPEHPTGNPDVDYRHEQLTQALQHCSEESTEQRGQVLQDMLRATQSEPDLQEQETLRERLVTRVAAELVYNINREGIITVRDEQLSSIAALLENTSLHAPTGSGKTSVIIPIAALARAFDGDKPLIVETASPELVDVLKQRLLEMAERLPESLRSQLSLVQLKNSNPSSADTRPQEFAALAKRLIEHNIAASSLETPGDILRTQRSSLFTKFVSDREAQFVDCRDLRDVKILPGGPTIILGQEGPSRFFTMRQPDAIGGVIADEADIAFNRNTGYLTTIEPGIITPEATETYLTDRLLASVVATLADEMEDPDELFDTVSDPSRPEFRTAIHTAAGSCAAQLGVESEQLETWFMNRIVTARTAQLAVGGSLQDVFSAQYLACLQARDLSEGSHYSVGQKGPVVRDHFMGLQLPSHQFQYQVMLALQTQHDAFEYKSPDVAERDASSFQGAIVNALGGRYAGLSGTFFSRELASETPVKGHFATFIEHATGKEPVYFAQEETKKVPMPTIETAEALEQRLRDETSDERQIFIACFNEQDGKALQEKLAKVYPDRTCILISDSLTDTETNELLTSFADTDRAIVISTGRTGVGVDIKTSAGAHTDHKTILYGIPFTQTQVFQALGRRRLSSTSESDASWIIDMQSLETHPYFLALEENQREKMRRDMQNDSLRSIDKLIRRGVEISRVSDERHLQVDQAYNIVRQQFEAKIQSRIPGLIDDIFASDPDARTLLAGFLRDMRQTDVETYAKGIVGCPAELYWQVRRQLGSYSGYGSSAYHRLIGSLDTTVASDEAVSEWLETKKDEIRYTLKTVLASALKETLTDDVDPQSATFVTYGVVPMDKIAQILDVEGARKIPILDPESGIETLYGVMMNQNGTERVLQENEQRRIVPIKVVTPDISIGVLYSNKEPQT